MPRYRHFNRFNEAYSIRLNNIPDKPPNRVLVLGSKGMLGHVVYDLFKRNVWINPEVVYGAHREQDGDLTDEHILKHLVETVRPDLIVNCVGVLIKGAEDDHVKALKANTLLPWMLLSWSREYNFKLIHISTDCVFNGIPSRVKPQFYFRASRPDAGSWYGMTKAMGELTQWGTTPGDFFFEITRNVTIFRTSIIGPELKQDGTGLFHWAMTNKQPSLFGYQVHWNGVTTLQLAKLIVRYGYKNRYAWLRHPCSPIVSKAKLLELIGDEFNSPWVVVEQNGTRAGAKLLAPSKIFKPYIPTLKQQIFELKDYMLHSPNYETYKEIYEV